MKRIAGYLAVLLAAGLPAPAAPAPAAPAPAVDALVALMPPEVTASAAPAYAAVLQAGPDAVADLCSRLAPLGTGDNAKVRFALQGLALHAARPASGKDPAVFAAGVGAALPRATNAEVRAFMVTLFRTAGGPDAVPALAPLLAVPDARDVAIAALVAQASPAADDALLKAFRSAPAADAAALAKALGDRRVAAAAADLDRRSAEPGLGPVALYALASIGAPESRAVVARLAGTNAWAEVLRYDARLIANGRAADAATLARDLLGRGDALPAHDRCAALTILSDAAGAGALPELKAALASSDRILRHAAASRLAQSPDPAAGVAIAAALKDADPGLRADFLRLLAMRKGDAAAADAAAGCLADADAVVRESAVVALARLKGADAVPVLLGAMTPGADPAILATLANGLKRLPREAAAAPCLDACSKATGAVRVALVPVAALLGGDAGQEVLLKALADADADVRRAALAAAESCGAPALLPKLAAIYTGAADSADRNGARKALVAIARDIADPAARPEAVLAAMASAEPAARAKLIELLPMLGGARALDAVTAALGDAAQREAAVRALAAWSDAAALPKLMELAKAKDAGSTPILALRGALRIATQDAALANRDRLKIYREALALPPARDEKLQLLAGLAKLNGLAPAELAGSMIEDAAVRADAAASVARILLPEKEGKAPPVLAPAAAELLRRAAPHIADAELRKRAERALPKEKSPAAAPTKSPSATPDAPATTAAPSPAPDAEGFVPLFNGRDLAGWIAEGSNYEVTNGVILCPKGKGRRLMSEREYANFVLRMDFKLTRGANNGLAIRAPLEGDAAYTGMELQIIDNETYFEVHNYKLQPWQVHGSIYGVVPAKTGALKPAGEWNHQEVRAIGDRIEVILNGTTIVDADLSKVTETADGKGLKTHPGLARATGHIGFLGHGDEIEVRDIRIREIPNVAPRGFTALFNGRDLTGWKGLAGNPLTRAKMTPDERTAAQAKADERMRAHWSVADGALVFDGKGDALCTTRDYGDFEMLVDWKILANGDSGIYIRGSPQVQIWDATKHPEGSGGLYNNQKNPSKPLVCADRPIGEWNSFRIRMTGERVSVDLNGVPVVTNTVMENYWDRKQPIFPTGQIELQNHGNTLWFRNVYIRELEAAPAAP